MLLAADVIDVVVDVGRIAQRYCSAEATVARGAAAIDTHGAGLEGLLALRTQRIRAACRTARERISFSFFFFFPKKSDTVLSLLALD